jgi:hypothetical protein
MGVVQRRTVSEDTDAIRYDRQTERRWALDPSDIIALLAGLLFLVMGLIALVELGFTDFPSEEVTDVMGLAHTQLVGIVGIVLGLLLLAGSGSVGRSVTTFAGALTLVVGIVVVAASEDLDATLATEEAYGWLAVVVGAIVLLAAIAIPSTATRHERVVDDVHHEPLR